MADETKKPRRRKAPETVRQRAEKQLAAKTKKSTPKKRKIVRPVHAVRRLAGREYHPVKLPDNKIGRFLTKRRKLTPTYFGQSWAELKLVRWPNRRETLHLTLAVFLFALFFTILIQIINILFEFLFKEIVLR